MAFQYEKASDEEIVQHCQPSNPNRIVISELEGGHSIVKLSEEVVVKFGFGVYNDEAQNQEKAYEIIKSSAIPIPIRVPKVYRFFTSEDVGYFVMEYVDGKELSTFENPDIFLNPMAEALKSFEQIQHHKPGPFCEGLAIGQLWHHPYIKCSKTSDIEEYYNTRLSDSSKLSLKNYSLVFCHLDIAPRNILVLTNGTLCLIDWASAGFYPRLFERCVLKMNVRGKDSWNLKLLELLDALDEYEKAQVQLLEKAVYLGVKYSYYMRGKKQKPPTGTIRPSKTLMKAARERRRKTPLQYTPAFESAA